MIPLLYYVLFISLFIAFACSLIQFRLHAIQLKLFSVLLGIDFLSEYLATFGMKYMRSWFHIKNNLAIYNVFMLIEFVMYAFFFLLIIKIKWLKKLIAAFIVFFPVIWLVGVHIFGIYGWDSYIQVTGSTFIIIVGLLFFYQLYSADELISLNTNSEFWIVAGLVIFYICNLPFMGMFNYLTTYYEHTAENLLSVLQLFAIVMYSLIIYAFLCRIKTTKSSLT